MSKLKNTDELSSFLSSYNPTYLDGFANRVMAGIESEINNKTNSDTEFYNIFRWVAASGIAAIVVLLLSVYITEGSFTADALYGLINYSPDEPIIAYLNY